MNPVLTSYFPNSHAVLIGINAYQKISPLRNAVHDVQRVAEVLEHQTHGFQVHPPLIDAPYVEIMELLTQTLPETIGQGDRLLFYFAGHGIAIDSEEEGIPEGYLLPADADPHDTVHSLAMSTLRKYLEALPCKHVLLVLDCCFSGAFRWTSSNKRGIGSKNGMNAFPKKIYQERFDRFAQDTAWQVITSASHDQEAFDSLYHQPMGSTRNSSGSKNSPFALHFINALKGEADLIPTDEPNGLITASEIYWYIRNKLEPDTLRISKNSRQTPGFFYLPKHDKGEYFFLSPKVALNLPNYDPKRNPYKGLQSYQLEDQHHFFGRDQVVEDLASFFQDHPLIVISGASGSGKSSLVKAGLLPIIQKEGYSYLSMRPGEKPEEALELILQSEAYQSKAKLVLLIDQFEELITQGSDKAARQGFLQQLANLLEKESACLKLILTVRSDFEPQFQEGPLSPWWEKSRFVIPGFSALELREIIERPANERIILFDPPTLVDQIVDEVQSAPGALPLLSFTMSEMYEDLKQKGTFGAFQLATYRRLGGVTGALRTRADLLFEELSPLERKGLQKLMLRMISFEGGQMAKRKVFLDELIYEKEVETKAIQTVLDQLVTARLIVQSKDIKDKPYVEPAHEALIQAWGRLWDWVNTVGKETLLLQNRLQEAVAVYKENGENKSLLLHDDPRLDQFYAISQTELSGLNLEEEVFIRKSILLKNKKRRRFITTLIGTTLVLAALSLAAVWFGVEARRQATLARQEAQSSNFAALAAQRSNINPTQAIRLAEEALSIKPDNGSAKQTYQNIISQSTEQLFYQKALLGQNAAAFSPDGKWVLTASNDGQARIWTKDGALIRVIQAAEDTLLSVQFSPDSQSFLTTDWQGKVKVWSFAGEEIYDIKCNRYPIERAVFADDGQQLLVGSWGGGDVLLLDLVPEPKLNEAYFIENTQSFLGSRTRTTYLRRISSRSNRDGMIAFSDDGQYFLTESTEGPATIRSTNPAFAPKEGTGLSDLFRVSAADFSANNELLIVGKSDGTVRVLSTEGELVRRLTVPSSSGISTVCISPQNNFYAAANEQGNIYVWDKSGQLYAKLNGHSGYITHLAFSPDEQLLLSSTLLSNDHALLWNLGQKTNSFLSFDNEANVNGAFFLNEGRQFILSGLNGIKLVNLEGEITRNIDLGDLDFASFRMDLSDDRTFFAAALHDHLHIQRVVEQRRIRVLAHDGLKILALDISPNGKMIVTTGLDGKLKLWSAERGEAIRSIQLEGSPLSYSVAFMADNEHLLLGTAAGQIEIINLQGRPLHRFSAHDDAIIFMKSSHDGRYTLTGGLDGMAKLWDEDWTLRQSFSDFKKGVLSGAFSPDDQLVLLGGEEGIAHLYDLEGSLQQSFDRHEQMIKSVDISPDGDLALSIGDRGQAYLWRIQSDLLSAGMVAPLRPAERAQFGISNDLVSVLAIDDPEQLLDFAFFQEQLYLYGDQTEEQRMKRLEDMQVLYDKVLSLAFIQKLSRERLLYLGNYFGKRYVKDDRLKKIYDNNVEQISKTLKSIQ